MNRFRTGQGPCRANLNKCGLAQSFLWLWPATDHEPRCRHVPVNKIWTWTESTPRSGWWHSHAAEIYSDCSIHKIIINTGCTIKITALFSCIVAWLETAGVSLHPHAQSSNGTHGHASAPTLDIVGTESIMVPSNFYNWFTSHLFYHLGVHKSLAVGPTVKLTKLWPSAYYLWLTPHTRAITVLGEWGAGSRITSIFTYNK